MFITTRAWKSYLARIELGILQKSEQANLEYVAKGKVLLDILVHGA